ncbi:hypothetical protein [Aquisphaera insulae]|uniref:hypothetical protein n=1 Tax=Aquisphaera insulae TaxID=2712864 RepID=UPI0013EC6B07|nr:hypothetical protein [Aquisphaera insulae]
MIPCEQAVYGSFPFWNRGYAILARSAGCRPEWLDALRRAAQKYGERPTGIPERAALFAMRLPRGPWMIVGVFPQGADDRGRPGALAFHGLFVDPRSYARSGASPFPFAGSLRGDWTAADEDATLPAASWAAARPAPTDTNQTDRAISIAARIRRGERVSVRSSEPIDDLARAVWNLLPGRVRRRASMATWAFSEEKLFDLMAMPLLPGSPGEPDLLIPTETARRPPGRRPAVLGLAALLLGISALLFVLFRGRSGLQEGTVEEPSTPLAPRSADREPQPTRASLVPPASPDEMRPASVEEIRRMSEALASLADRLGSDVAEPPPADAAESIRRLAERLRYRGPLLGDEDLARLETLAAAEGPPPRGGRGPLPTATSDAANALRWHDLVIRFRGDRRLPAGINQEPPRRQLALLAWIFHLEDDPGISEAVRHGTPEEIVHALADALLVDLPLPRTSLATSFAPLDEYRNFLGSLPRK